MLIIGFLNYKHVDPNLIRQTFKGIILNEPLRKVIEDIVCFFSLKSV